MDASVTPMAQDPQLSLANELQTHAAAMRRLAKGLLRDEHGANDLWQETALRAVQHKPAANGSLGGWLTTVLQRLAGNARRDEQRRLRREAAAAAPADPADPADLAMRRESMQRLTTALFALPEPYRSTLQLRYFEDLGPRAIAARTATSVATVKSRLQRGLQLLRARMDQQQRNWRPALGLALGVPFASPLAIAGAMGMVKGKLLAGAAGVAVVAWVVWPRPEPVAIPQQVAGVDQAAAAQASGEAPEHVAPAADREQIDDARPHGVDIAHPYEFSLLARVIDARGNLQPDCKVMVAPNGVQLNDLEQHEQDDGTVLLTWRGRQPEMRVQISTEHKGRLFTEELAMRAGARVQRTMLGSGNERGLYYVRLRNNELVMSGKPRLTGKLLVESLAIASQPAGCAAGNPNNCRSCHNNDVTTLGMRNWRQQPAPGLHGEAPFSRDSLRAPAPEQPVETSAVLSLEARSFSAWTGRLAVHLGDSTEAAEKATSRIVGVVRNSDGTPAAKEHVALTFGSVRMSATADDEGRFAFDVEGTGPVLIRAGGAEGGLAEHHDRLTGGSLPDLQLKLAPINALRGKAIGKDGKPLAGAHVLYQSADGGWIDLAKVRDDGTWLMPNLPGPGRLLVLPREGLPIAMQSYAAPDGPAVDFDLRTLPNDAGLRMRLQTGDEVPRRVTVLVEQIETGLVAEMSENKAGDLLLADLMPGGYRITVLSDLSGTIALGEQWLSPGMTVDLGTRMLPAAAVLTVRDPSPLEGQEGDAFELYQRLPGCDVRAPCTTQLRSSVPIQLAAGDWLVAWRGLNGATRMRPFRVAPGEQLELTLER